MPNGIIISASSNLYQIEVENKIYNCTARGKFKKEGTSPLVGDKVEITISNEEKYEGVIEQILPRYNEIKRPKMANLTELILVVSMKMPSPDLLLLDKELAFAKWLGINAVICFNKIDLSEQEEVKKLSEIYKNIGYTVIETNAKSEEQVEKIKPFLKNNITAFAGNSGVGKSTLTNSIFKTELTAEGIISNKNKKGKNTTTTVTLYKYDNNSYIADTPGFSTLELTEISSSELDKYFIEFLPYLNKCEFGGCSHIKEEKCGVKEALQNGKISLQRYQNYQKIYEELKEREKNKW